LLWLLLNIPGTGTDAAPSSRTSSVRGRVRLPTNGISPAAPNTTGTPSTLLPTVSSLTNYTPCRSARTPPPTCNRICANPSVLRFVYSPGTRCIPSSICRTMRRTLPIYWRDRRCAAVAVPVSLAATAALASITPGRPHGFSLLLFPVRLAATLLSPPVLAPLLTLTLAAMLSSGAK
jgi:hypothetical protein